MANKDFVVKNSLIVGSSITIGGIALNLDGITSGQILKYNGTEIAAANAVADPVVYSYTTTFGDGSNADYVITHSLNTKNIVVIVSEASSPFQVVKVGWEATSDNTITLRLAGPVLSSSRKVLIFSVGDQTYYNKTIGDGAATSISIVHSLGSRDVIVVAKSITSPYEQILVDAHSDSSQVVTLDFNAPPGADSIIVSIFLPLENHHYRKLVGDDTSKNIVINHGLGTRNVGLISRDAGNIYDFPEVLWEATSLDTITLRYSVAPSLNSRYITVYSGIGGAKRISESIIDLSVNVPDTSSSTGVTGDIAFNSSYLYICTSQDTWKRIALSSW